MREVEMGNPKAGVTVSQSPREKPQGSQTLPALHMLRLTNIRNCR
jgi:hypothetical protein